MRSTFKLLFYLNRGKVKKNGCSPILGRITIDGNQTQFSTGLEVTSEKWDAGKSLILGRSDEAKLGNEKMKQLRKEAERHYAKLLDRDGYVTAERIKNELLGITGQIPTLLSEAQSLCEDMRERVGKTHTLSTYKGYVCGYNNLKEFIHENQGFEDIAFTTLEYDFIEDYDFFLRVDKKQKPNTVKGLMIFLRKLVRTAVQKRYIYRDPFAGYEPQKAVSERKWLTLEEIGRIMATPIRWERANYIRHMFIFCCFTGLSRADLVKLTPENIVTNERGGKEIRILREKTEVEAIIPLTEIPLQILELYKDDRMKGRYFRNIEKCTASIFCKTIAEAVGLDKPLTFHQARHSFSTSICLNNGMPIETLSKILGHRSISTTQIYAKITHQKVAGDMNVLAEKIETEKLF